MFSRGDRKAFASLWNIIAAYVLTLWLAVVVARTCCATRDREAKSSLRIPYCGLAERVRQMKLKIDHEETIHIIRHGRILETIIGRMWDSGRRKDAVAIKKRAWLRDTLLHVIKPAGRQQVGIKFSFFHARTVCICKNHYFYEYLAS